MKLNHTRESDFVTVELDYPDFQYNLAKLIADTIETPYPILSSDDGRRLILLAKDTDAGLTRTEYEMGNGKYKIIIEPLS